jgi:hypothetical protein
LCTNAAPRTATVLNSRSRLIEHLLIQQLEASTILAQNLHWQPTWTRVGAGPYSMNLFAIGGSL